MFKHLTALFITLLMALIFVQCQNDAPQLTEAEGNLPTYWTAQQMTDYYANFAWPENMDDFEIQFYNHKHRSQLGDDELSILKAREQKFRDRRQDRALSKVSVNRDDDRKYRTLSGGSSYYFWETNYDSGDETDWDDCEALYDEAGLTWDSGESEWWCDCDGQSNTSDVTGARSYLLAHCSSSTFTGLLGTTTSYSNSPTGTIGGGYLFKSRAPSYIDLSGDGSDRRNQISVIPGSYVFADLNPSLEDWTSNYPDAWQRSIPSPYNIPSGWQTYFPINFCTQNGTEKSDGSYSADLWLRDPPDNYLTTAYFEIPQENRKLGRFNAEVDIHGGTGAPGTAFILFGLALFDFDDDLIADSLWVCDNIPTGSGVWATYNAPCATPTQTPSYVRMTVAQTTARNNTHVYVDNLRLRDPTGAEVSLPVGWGDLTSATQTGSSSINCEWYTESELQNAGFSMFWRDGAQIELASEVFIDGQGNDPNGHSYDENFLLYGDAKDYWKDEEEVTIFMGAKDYLGAWEYFESDAITVYDTK